MKEEDDQKPAEVNGETQNESSPMPAATNSKSTTQAKQYGRVVISLENPILPVEMIEKTPSSLDGLDAETETALRITGCRLIQLSGTLLKLPQTAMATAQVLFQRYYYSKSFVRFPMEFTCMACVVLASKVEEAPRRTRDIINVFNNIKQIRLAIPLKAMILDENYISLKNQVIKMERRILKELGFCVHVKHPHKFIIAIANLLNIRENSQLIQSAWNYMNDSLQTNVFVRYSPEAIACACLHLSSRILRIPLPPWYVAFNMESETIEDICKTILTIYTSQLPNQEVLEKKVHEARKTLDEAKAIAREKALLESNKLEENTNDSLDSRTNSPKVLPATELREPSLHTKSVINRLKQANESNVPPTRLKSTVVVQADSDEKKHSSNDDNDVDSRTSTPAAFKLQKSPTEDRGERHSSDSDYSDENDRKKRRKHDSRERHRDEHKHYDDYDSGHKRRRSTSRDFDDDYRYRSNYKSHRQSPSPGRYHSSQAHRKPSRHDKDYHGERNDKYRRYSRSRTPDRYRERDRHLREYKSSRSYRG